MQKGKKLRGPNLRCTLRASPRFCSFSRQIRRFKIWHGGTRTDEAVHGLTLQTIFVSGLRGPNYATEGIPHAWMTYMNLWKTWPLCPLSLGAPTPCVPPPSRTLTTQRFTIWCGPFGFVRLSLAWAHHEHGFSMAGNPIFLVAAGGG